MSKINNEITEQFNDSFSIVSQRVSYQKFQSNPILTEVKLLFYFQRKRLIIFNYLSNNK